MSNEIELPTFSSLRELRDRLNETPDEILDINFGLPIAIVSVHETIGPTYIGVVPKKNDEIKVGDIYKDCAYHPVRCKVVDGDDIEGVSLVDGSKPRSCSISHCGVQKITEEEAQELVQIWKTGGERAVLIHEGWSEEAADKFIKEWRR